MPTLERKLSEMRNGYCVCVCVLFVVVLHANARVSFVNVS